MVAINYTSPNKEFSLQVSDLQLDKRPTLLLGVNGAGKTTLLRILGGELKTEHGSRDRFPGAVYVSQNFVDIRGFTTFEYVGYIAWLNGATRKKAFQETGLWADYVGLGAQQNTKCSNLSGGQQARLRLAAALNSEADTLLLDEPSAALDPLAKSELIDLYEQIISDGIGLWVSTHQAHEVIKPFTRVIVLHEGALEFDGDLEQFESLAEMNDLSVVGRLASALNRGKTS